MGKCFQKNGDSTNCSYLWQTFSMGAEQDMWRATIDDFKPFFAVASFGSDRDNALFWSGNKNFATTLSDDGTRFTTLEDTSTGYILNGLSWCGKRYEDGIPPAFDYQNSCDYAQNSSYFGSQGVWNQCSRSFASTVSGKVNVLLQPQPLYYTSGPSLAYRSTSIFKLIELPSMDANLVTEIRILLLINKTSAPKELCGQGSLKDLRNDIVAKFHFEPLCVDDPEEIIRILCDSGQQTTPECMAAYMTAHEASRSILVWALVGTCSAVVLLITVIGLVLTVIKMKKQIRYSPIR